MANLVSKTPNLPLATGSINPGDLAIFDANIVKQLIPIFVDIARRVNAALVPDGTEGFKSFTVATLPAVVTSAMIYVSDESGGATLAFGDGTNWRRVQDRAIVS